MKMGTGIRQLSGEKKDHRGKWHATWWPSPISRSCGSLLASVQTTGLPLDSNTGQRGAKRQPEKGRSKSNTPQIPECGRAVDWDDSLLCFSTREDQRICV